MSYILSHGFGFTNEYWKNLIPLLDDDYEFFDESANYEKEYIGIGHSIGFQKLNNSGIKFKALIGLQTFLNFCGTDQTRKLRLKNLDRMINAFSKDPKKALTFFYELCGYKAAIPSDIDKDILIQDLNSMKNSYNHCGAQTLIICSTADKVVSYEITQMSFQKTKNIQIITTDIESHTLGYDQPDMVMNFVHKFLNEIKNKSLAKRF